MSTFAPQAVRSVDPDPFKHINYTLGMILGVDHFKQDFAYLSGRAQWLARGLLGYGTICGLRVTAQPAGGTDGWEILVSAGAALNPMGQFIRVPAAQCAKVNPWLRRHLAEVQQWGGSPPAAAHLYVTLCYAQCEVDPEPIPGEPCRSEDDSMAASRIVDDYRLELSWAPPDQRQEDAVRDFVAWLRLIPVQELPDTESNLRAFIDAVRKAVPQLRTPPESPPSSPPDYMVTPPPAGLYIPAVTAGDYLRRAFLLWTTELRGLWLGPGETCSGDLPAEACVLLAEVDIPLASNFEVSDILPVVVDEARRPYVLSLRMLQEWLLTSGNGGPGGGLSSPPDLSAVFLMGDTEGLSTDNTVAGLQGTPLVRPTAGTDDGRLLQFTGSEWRVTDVPGVPGAVNAKTGVADLGAIDPGTTKISDPIAHGLGENPPITLGIERLVSPADTQQVALLTVLYEQDRKSFRIAATNLAQSDAISSLLVRWWALGV
jgi:hypothetical protein